MTARIIEGRFALPDSPVQEGLHGKVFKASDLRRDHPVAFKLFAPARVMDDRVLRQVWSAELESYQTLGADPNLVELVEWGRTEEVELRVGTRWTALAYPFSMLELYDLACEIKGEKKE